MGNKIDLTGQSFNEWSVLGESGLTGSGGIKWLCICSCGTERLERNVISGDGDNR